MRNTFLALSACLLFTGCQAISYTSPKGEKFTRYAIGNKVQLESLSVTADTNGVRTVEMKGYANDQAAALGAVTAAAVSAAVSAVKP